MESVAEVLKKEENKIVEFNEFESKLADFKARYDDVVYDLDDPKQDKQARSDKYAIGQVISNLDKKHQEIKAPLKARTDLIDGERKRIKDDLKAVQDKIKDKIAEHERKIQEHAEMLQAKVEYIESFAGLGDDSNFTSATIKERISELNNIDIDDSYEHRKADATLAKVDTLKNLEEMLERRLKLEAEREELERLRREEAERKQREHEEEIKREAAEKARIDAENKANAEQERVEREKREAVEREEAAKRKAEDAERRAKEAEAARIAAVEKAKRDAELAAEQARLDEIARREEEERQAKAEQEKREANKRHIGNVRKQAKEGLMLSCGLSEDAAKNVVLAIHNGDIRHIKIEY